MQRAVDKEGVGGGRGEEEGRLGGQCSIARSRLLTTHTHCMGGGADQTAWRTVARENEILDDASAMIIIK